MDKISYIYNFLSRYKYIVTIIVGTFIVGFADSNSFYNRMVLQYQIMDLKNEIEHYNKIYHNDSEQLRALERDPRNIERIAREHYFMKANDEDIYVLSTDPRIEDEKMTSTESKNETAD